VHAHSLHGVDIYRFGFGVRPCS